MMHVAGKKYSRAEVAAMIEHSVLAPNATAGDIAEGCVAACRLGVKVMMVQPVWLELAARELSGSAVIPASVLAFPHGTALPAAKAFEAERLALRGARELDMVMDIGALKSGDVAWVEDDIRGVVLAAGLPVKVILEICLLKDPEIVDACKLCEAAGAAFVKTSTGFSRSGATPEAVALMRRTVSPCVGVKASGGIRTAEGALAMIENGASRIGTSASEAILDAWKE